jgi:RPA family protein
MEQEQKKRNIAYKLRIGDLLKSKPIIQEGKFLFAELGDKKIVRVNMIANVVDKFIMDTDKKYATLTIDDASGQIRLKTFGDDIALIKDLTQGDTLQIVGIVREYNNELYISPEIAKKVDPRWLLVRKLEIQSTKKQALPSNSSLRDILLDKIKQFEKEGGVDTDNLILESDFAPEIINSEIKKLLEEGLVYEPRPGRLNYLG